MTLVFFALGLVALIAGAEALVRGASRLAAALGIAPLVIGLTVVAFGTSSPELAVSVNAALTGQENIALGNVVGSNIFNVLMILGLSALIVPLVVAQQLVRLDVPLMLGLSILVLLLCLDGGLGRVDALVLVACLGVYLGYLFALGRKTAGDGGQHAESKGPPRTGPGWAANSGLVVAGLALLVLGSHWLVDGAVAFAAYLGISELVIGLTIVAAGTSLPEVVTSVVAALRSERDIAVGNVVGSNIFNLTGVLGLAGLAAPGGIAVSTAVISFDLPVMIVVALACLPVFFTGNVISRPEGALLLGYYVAYTLYLVLAAAHHDALPVFSAVMLYFALPLTVATISIVAWRQWRASGRRPSPPGA